MKQGFRRRIMLDDFGAGNGNGRKHFNQKFLPVFLYNQASANRR